MHSRLVMTVLGAVTLVGCGSSESSGGDVTGGSAPSGTGGRTSGGQGNSGGQGGSGKASGGQANGGLANGGQPGGGQVSAGGQGGNAPTNGGQANGGQATSGSGGDGGTPGFEPCAGKSCGEACQLCGPDDEGCVEDAIPLACNAEGECEAAPAMCETGPCSEAIFEGGGEGCEAQVWAWNGDACEETAFCECSSGECDRVFATATECQEANTECLGTTVPTPSSTCEATVFESTNDGCVETSWVWDGNDCTSTTHCGCASGECDRLYDDYASCEGAHAACIPNGCAPQDARSNGTMCGTIAGYAFSGWSCQEVICGCSGEDCAEIADTLEECESAFPVCLERVPACFDGRFPVEASDVGFDPVHPEYTFSVEGYDDLYDAQSSTVAVFAEWTDAQWGGLEEVDVEPETCPAIDGMPIFVFPTPCPYPQQIVLQAAEETFRVNVSLHWSLVGEMAAPADVEVRIVAHPSGTLVLQIRDAATELPIMMVVQSEPEIPSGESPWELAPFSFEAGEKLCKTEPTDCRWSFSPLGLEISTGESELTMEPLRVESVEVGGLPYRILHGYLFQRYETGDHACSSVDSPRQSFALVAGQE